MQFTFIEVILLVIIVYLLFTVIALDGRIKGMRNTLDRMAKKLDLPENPVNIDIRKLLHEGKDVEAVKLAREVLGLSLIEGKKYVDVLKSNNK